MKFEYVLRLDDISDGLICLEIPDDPGARTILWQLYSDCKNKFGGLIRVAFSKPYARRTTGKNSQNNMIHGFAAQIANFIGDDIESVKAYCKEKAISLGYPVKRDDDGNVIISKLTDKPIPESSANVSTVEASILIEQIQLLAAELGIRLEE